MKELFKSIVLAIITWQAKIVLKLHKPKVICITGSVGKTSAKDISMDILRDAEYRVSGSKKSYNSEFGVPLGVLGFESGISNLLSWFLIILGGFWRIFWYKWEVLVLEVGVDKKGDMEMIVEWIKPDISCLTQLAEFPVHLDGFSNREELYREKILLLEETKDVIVVNGLDSIQMTRVPNKKKISFGKGDINLISSGIHLDELDKPIGTDFILEINGKEEPMYMPSTLVSVNSVIAAIAICIAFNKDISISKIRKAIASREPTPGRMRIIKGRNWATIVDDSYNASPIAVKSSVDFLGPLQLKKIAVFGRMLELGEFLEEAKSLVANALNNNFDVLICVDSDYPTDSSVEKIKVKTIDEAVQSVEKYLSEGNMILCKGSQGSRIEKVVEKIIDEDVELVRQSKEWK